MGEIDDTNISVERFVGLDDEPVRFNVSIELGSEVVDCSGGVYQSESDGDSRESEQDEDESELDEHESELDEDEATELLFPEDAEPDKREYEGYTGNCSPTLDFWYNRACIMVWPSSETLRVALADSIDAAVTVACQRSTRYGPTSPRALSDLAVIVARAAAPSKAYYYANVPPGQTFLAAWKHATRVLRLCADAGKAALSHCRRVLQILSGKNPQLGAPGIQTEQVADAVADLVLAVGWDAVGDEVVQLVKTCALEQALCVARLALKLQSVAAAATSPPLFTSPSEIVRTGGAALSFEAAMRAPGMTPSQQ